MSLEYCDSCDSEVQAERVILNNKMYTWKCPMCCSLYSIEYSQIHGDKN